MSVSRTEWSRVLLRVPFERSAQAILGGADLHIRSQIPDGKSSSLRLRQSLLVKQKQRLKIDQIVTSVCVRGPIRSCRIFAGVVTGVLPVSTGTVGGRLVAPQTRPVQSRVTRSVTCFGRGHRERFPGLQFSLRWSRPQPGIGLRVALSGRFLFPVLKIVKGQKRSWTQRSPHAAEVVEGRRSATSSCLPTARPRSLLRSRIRY